MPRPVICIGGHWPILVGVEIKKKKEGDWWALTIEVNDLETFLCFFFCFPQTISESDRD